MNRAAWQEHVADEIASTGIVDAHEHILSRAQREQINPDLFDWVEASYYYAALLASGMPSDEFRSRGPDDASRRWQVMRPHLQRTRTSAYAHIIDLATRDLFGTPFSGLNDSNWRELSAQIQAANAR